MKITLPKGYELPEGAKPGEAFEAVASITLNEDGTYDLSAIDGVELAKEEDEEMEDEEMEDGEDMEDDSPMAKLARNVQAQIDGPEEMEY
jgi:hypothetical protein